MVEIISRDGSSSSGSTQSQGSSTSILTHHNYGNNNSNNNNMSKRNKKRDPRYKKLANERIKNCRTIRLLCKYFRSFIDGHYKHQFKIIIRLYNSPSSISTTAIPTPPTSMWDIVTSSILGNTHSNNNSNNSTNNNKESFSWKDFKEWISRCSKELPLEIYGLHLGKYRVNIVDRLSRTEIFEILRFIKEHGLGWLNLENCDWLTEQDISNLPRTTIKHVSLCGIKVLIYPLSITTTISL